MWIRGGYNKCKKIFFCHAYREHLSQESTVEQQNYLSKFLSQWEAACYYGGTSEANETHVCGDINIDVYQGKWLHPRYPLLSLSKLIKNCCHANNFYQLVGEATRVQYNSVINSTDVSCIDHVYTNTRFRCSDPSVIAFGGSDHDLVKYIRFSKNPVGPTRTLRKRTYKYFDKDNFLKDISSVDWHQVYSCDNVDMATETFTNIFRFILNKHAPWVKFQQRQNFKPWITEETKSLMATRDHWKHRAKNLPNGSPTQVYAWSQFKEFRNKVNNKKKFEENIFKAENMMKNIDSPTLMWKSAKSFMGWTSHGSPQQLQVGNKLMTSARDIAHSMNDYFITKVKGNMHHF